MIKYAQECLENSFSDSGLALQDIINEFGRRLGFFVTDGLYRGNKNEIGYDGIWKQSDGWNLIIEVKTTDAYRISLDTIANYRTKLISEKSVDKINSSILLVVGRNDTGELEAQIRGSKHAWDIRIISIDSLIRLLNIKESLSDSKTSEQINKSLRPFEYTRIDTLIELLFSAIKDIEVEENVDNDNFESIVDSSKEKSEKKFTPVNFHKPIYELINKKFGISFIKNTRSSFISPDSKTGFIISISKKHPPYNSQFDARYWFAFHPHQNDFLKKLKNSYACYGCGSENHSFLIPYEFLSSKIDYRWETKSDDREYKHIVIYQKGEDFFLRTNFDEKEHYDKINDYKI